MKKHNNIIIIISSLLIVVGVIAGSVLTKYASEISTIVTTVTAIIGAVALWVQFKKDREINQASFVIEFFKSFQESDSNLFVMEQMDNKFDGLPYTHFTEIHKDVLSYIYWIRTLCGLIERGVFSFDTIDEMFAYKFFSATNNKEIQKLELEKYPGLYKIVYRTHRKWTEYRTKNGLDIMYPDEDLSLCPNYEELSK